MLAHENSRNHGKPTRTGKRHCNQRCLSCSPADYQAPDLSQPAARILGAGLDSGQWLPTSYNMPVCLSFAMLGWNNELYAYREKVLRMVITHGAPSPHADGSALFFAFQGRWVAENIHTLNDEDINHLVMVLDEVGIDLAIHARLICTLTSEDKSNASLGGTIP
eukprot:8952121-Pyramimonas_sp.AAC.1